LLSLPIYVIIIIIIIIVIVVVVVVIIISNKDCMYSTHLKKRGK